MYRNADWRDASAPSFPNCDPSCLGTWRNLVGDDTEGKMLYRTYFKLTKSVMNFCECNPSDIYQEVLSEDPPYKCDRVVLEPVEVRENEELTYDAELGECNLFFDLTI